VLPDGFRSVWNFFLFRDGVFYYTWNSPFFLLSILNIGSGGFGGEWVLGWVAGGKKRTQKTPAEKRQALGGFKYHFI
jgi:hypothetical protein